MLSILLPFCLGLAQGPVSVPQTPPPFKNGSVQSAPELTSPQLEVPPDDGGSAAVPQPSPAELHERQVAKQRATAALPALHALFDPDRFLVFDRAGDDGLLWAAAADFKVAFDRDGYRFHARPDDATAFAQPIAFRLHSAQVGASLLSLQAAAPVQHGDRVDYHRGSLRESVQVTPRGIEQTFTFDWLPERGELRVTIAVDTSLVGQPDGDGLRFLGAHEQVTYSQAVAIDARGARLQVSTVYEDGAITIRVPAAFVASAVLPLVIDPWIHALQVSGGSLDLADPDIAWDENGQVWAVVFSRVFAAGDWDCYVQRISAGNPMTLVGNPTAIDVTSLTWQLPRIASLGPYSVFMVVGQTRTGTGTWAIRGRILANSGVAQTPQFLVSDGPYAALRPDIGGSTTAPGFFTVVWERVIDLDIDHNIVARQVGPTGVLSAGPLVVQGSTALEINPSISKSCGGQATPSRRFGIVYQQRNALGRFRIMAAMLSWDGLPVTVAGGGYNFALTPGAVSDLNPQVSSPTLPSNDGRRALLAVYERPTTNNGDILASCFDHTGTIFATGNISLLEDDPQRLAWPQRRPAVDCDGLRFVVAYHEVFAGSIPTNDLDTRVSLVVPYNGSFLLPERGVTLAYSQNREFNVQVASRYSGSGAYNFLTCTVNDRDNSNNTTFAIDAYSYDGTPPGDLGQRPTGCGGLPISATGQPMPGGQLLFQLASGSALAAFIAGMQIPAVPIPGCSGCQLGVDGITLTGANLLVTIPLDPRMLGVDLGVQGVALDPSGPCLSLLRFSDTLDATIR